MSEEIPAPGAAHTTVLDVEAPELVRTYADALVNVAEREGQAEALVGELEELVAEVLRPFPGFAALLRAPNVPSHEKDRILVETFEGKALPTLVKFMRVLNRHGRLGLLEPISRKAREIWNRRQNRQPVTVRSAVPLDDGEQATLHERLARFTGANPILKLEIDRALIGGLVVQIGDDVYDASVRNHLEQLRRRLVEGKTHEIQSRRDHFCYPA
jgi:F-type H+-transporting ATPase subunit delta